MTDPSRAAEPVRRLLCDSYMFLYRPWRRDDVTSSTSATLTGEGREGGDGLFPKQSHVANLVILHGKATGGLTFFSIVEEKWLKTPRWKWCFKCGAGTFFLTVYEVYEVWLIDVEIWYNKRIKVYRVFYSINGKQNKILHCCKVQHYNWIGLNCKSSYLKMNVLKNYFF